eukprot:12924898-Prorocentrum_lima.AAC.1
MNAAGIYGDRRAPCLALASVWAWPLSEVRLPGRVLAVGDHFWNRIPGEGGPVGLLLFLRV